MILTRAQNELRWQIDEAAFRCLHAILYFDGITGFRSGPSDYWRFSQNCFAEVACLNWCHLFNSENKDLVHYRNLFGNDQLVRLGKKFSHENVKSRLTGAASLTEMEYRKFRKEMIDFRNKWAAHRDFKVGPLKFPQLGHARAMCLAIRIILEETIDEELQIDPECLDLKDLKTHFSEQSNSWLFNKCGREIAYITKLVRS